MADPDLHIREGPSHPDPEMRGETWSPKNFFGPKAPPLPLDLPLKFSSIMTLNGT